MKRNIEIPLDKSCELCGRFYKKSQNCYEIKVPLKEYSEAETVPWFRRGTREIKVCQNCMLDFYYIVGKNFAMFEKNLDTKEGKLVKKYDNIWGFETETNSKEEFVKSQLEPLLIKVNPSIERVWYTSDDSTKEEMVTIYWESGDRTKVCVTANSLLAIVKDVLDKLKY